MKKRFLSICKVLLIIMPFLLGFCGFLIDGTTSIPDSLFKCLTMYFLNYGDSPVNLLVEAARWLAPFATASSLFLAISILKEHVHNYIIYKSGQSVAVYGSDADCQALLSQLGSHGIAGGEHYVRAQRYILTYSEDDNWKFYDQYKNQLENHNIYIKSDTLPTQLIVPSNLTLYSNEEITARLFWKELCIYPLVKEKNHALNIVFLGFGKLGEELLYHGLLNNLFFPDQHISYHIFGACEAFLKLHTRLDSISDTILQYSDPWYNHTDILENSDLILLVDQQNQVRMIHDLNMVLPQKQVVVFLARMVLEELLSSYNNLKIINWHISSNQIEYIMNDKLLYLAKSINLMYAHIYSGVASTKDNLDAEWKKLDTFTRNSNISAADYHEIRLQMLSQMGLPAIYDDIPELKLEYLTELEHIRWCRYHYLNNWKYGIPENGKNKDALNRIHKDLIPYDQLSESEKTKDRDNIRLLLSISPDHALQP